MAQESITSIFGEIFDSLSQLKWKKACWNTKENPWILSGMRGNLLRERKGEIYSRDSRACLFMLCNTLF